MNTDPYPTMGRQADIAPSIVNKILQPIEEVLTEVLAAEAFCPACRVRWASVYPSLELVHRDDCILMEMRRILEA